MQNKICLILSQLILLMKSYPLIPEHIVCSGYKSDTSHYNFCIYCNEMWAFYGYNYNFINFSLFFTYKSFLEDRKWKQSWLTQASQTLKARVKQQTPNIKETTKQIFQ